MGFGIVVDDELEPTEMLARCPFATVRLLTSKQPDPVSPVRNLGPELPFMEGLVYLSISCYPKFGHVRLTIFQCKTP